jgi:plasmid stabilization system protein ParE
VKIRYRPTALAQLDAIFAYIATHDDRAAHRVMSSIKRSIEREAERGAGYPRVADRALSLRRV